MGGPYGAAAGLALAAGQYAKPLLAAVAVLFLLPVLFVLMLPGLVFGDFTAQSGLNDSAAAIDAAPAEGIADAEARIALDFASTGGDNYEVVNPYSGTTINTNSFIAQYCAAKGTTWDEISLSDMQAILQVGKGRAPTTPSSPPQPRRGA